MENKTKNTLKTFAALMSAGVCFGAGNDSEFYKYTNYNPDAPESALVFDGFVSPKGKARVQTWWHWINGNVSRDGIDRDLKSMADNNYGAAIIFNIGGSVEVGTPKGGLKFNSKEWFGNFAYTVETAKKYGMEIGIHNCDGWSEAAGPWITPELSMKRLTSSKVRVSGGGVRKIKLPRPHAIANPLEKGATPYYKDIAVFAYPAFRPTESAMQKHFKSLKPANDETAPFGSNYTEQLAKRADAPFSFRFRPARADYKWYGADIEFEKPFEASSIYFNSMWSWSMPKNLFLAVSDDGKNFREIAKLNETSNESFVAFPPTTAKFWRIGKRAAKDNSTGVVVHALELIPTGQVARHAPYIATFGIKTARGRSLHISYDNAEIPAKAVIDPKRIIFVDEKISEDGTVNLRLPEGEWEVVRAGYTINGEYNHPATPTGIGLESDKLDASVTAFHIDSYVSKMVEAAGANAGGVFKYVETDSWECGPQNWTANMPAIFREFVGYDIMPWLPAMLGEVVESKAATEKFAADLRAFTAYTVNKNFYGKFGERLRSMGIEYECEPVVEVASLRDQLSLFKHADIPQDEIWQQLRKVGKPDVPRYAPTREVASATQFFGKKMATCEALSQAQGNWSDSPLSLKGCADSILLAGMNVLVFHDFSHQPDERVPGWQMEPWGSCINRKMPWFSLARDFFDYIARSQYMMQQGRARVDILRLMTEEPPVMAGFPQLSRGYYCNKINGDCVRNYLRVKNGNLVSPGRIEYKLLDIAPDAALRVETLLALKKLVSDGATVSAETLPISRTLIGGNEADRQWKKLARELFGDGQKGIVKIGAGKVYVGYKTADVVADMKLRPAYKTDVHQLAVIAREHANGTKWFYVVNCAKNDKCFDISFDATGKAEIWNPETAERVEVAERIEKDGYSTLRLDLHRNDSVFVVFDGKPAAQSVIETKVDGKPTFPKTKESFAVEETQTRLVRDCGGKLSAEFFKAGKLEATLSDGAKVSAKLEKIRESVLLKTPFTVEFEEQYGAPKSAAFERFESWTKHADPRIANYSGKAKYNLKVELPNLGRDERAYLQFGEILEIGRVKVNGKFAGTLWKKPFRIDITKFAKAGENAIEVEVGNTWVNRCLYDATLPPDQRITWSNSMGYHFPEKGKKPVPARGIDRSWTQGAIPSGIIGEARVEFSKTVPLK